MNSGRFAVNKWYGVEPWKGLFRREVSGRAFVRTCAHCGQQAWWEYREKMLARTTINFIPVHTKWFHGIVCPNCAWGIPLEKDYRHAARQMVALTGAWSKGTMSAVEYMAACASNSVWQRFAEKGPPKGQRT